MIALRPRASSFVLAIFMTIAPARTMASEVAPESPRERSEALLIEGDAAIELGDCDAAFSHYRASYSSLPEADRASYLGSIPIRKAMEACEQCVAREPEPARRHQLRVSQRLLLARFLATVRARGAVGDVGEDVIVELEGSLRALDEELAAEQHGNDEQGARALAPAAPATPEMIEPDQDADEGDESLGDGKLHWGWTRPQPRWKWAVFGVSASVLAASAAATIGTGVWLSSETRGFRRKLLDTAKSSLTDSNPLNDVDPNLPVSVDLCSYARERPDPAQPDLLRNSSIAHVCDQREAVSKGQIGAAVMTGVGLAATVAFTIVLFIHREPVHQSAWRRRGSYVGLDSARGGGLLLRAGGRF